MKHRQFFCLFRRRLTLTHSSLYVQSWHNHYPIMKLLSLLVCIILSNDQPIVSALTWNARTSKVLGLSPLLSSTVLEPAAVSQAQPLYDRVAWETGFSTCKKEVCEVISTSLPLDIRGTYYRCGTLHCNELVYCMKEGRWSTRCLSNCLSICL